MRVFYPKKKGKNWDDFLTMAKNRYGEADQLCEIVTTVLPMLKFVRNTRDCLEHHLTGVTVRDFEPELNGDIAV